MGSKFDFEKLVRLLEVERVSVARKNTAKFDDCFEKLKACWNKNDVSGADDAAKTLPTYLPSSSKATPEIKGQLKLVKMNIQKKAEDATKQKTDLAVYGQKAQRTQQRTSDVDHLESVLHYLTKICEDNGINKHQTAMTAVSPKPGKDKDGMVQDKIHGMLDSLKKALEELSMQAGTRKIAKASEQRVAKEIQQKEEREPQTDQWLCQLLDYVKSTGKQNLSLEKGEPSSQRRQINEIGKEIKFYRDSINLLREELVRLKADIENWDTPLDAKQFGKWRKEISDCEDSDLKLCVDLRVNIYDTKQKISKQNEENQKSTDSLRQELQKLQSEMDDWNKNTGGDKFEKLMKKEEKPVGPDAECCRTLRFSLSKKKEVIGKQMEAHQNKDKSIDSLRQELQKLQSEIDDWDKNTSSDKFENLLKKEEKPVGHDAELCRTLRSCLSKKKEVLGKKKEARQDKDKSMESLRQELQNLKGEMDDWDKTTGSDKFEKMLKKEDKPVGQDAELCRTLRSSLSKKKEAISKKMEARQNKDNSVDSLLNELQNLESEIHDWDKNADSPEFVKLLEKEDKPVGLYAELCRRLRANLSQRKQGMSKREELERERDERMTFLRQELDKLTNELNQWDKMADVSKFESSLKKENEAQDTDMDVQTCRNLRVSLCKQKGLMIKQQSDHQEKEKGWIAMKKNITTLAKDIEESVNKIRKSLIGKCEQSETDNDIEKGLETIRVTLNECDEQLTTLLTNLANSFKRINGDRKKQRTSQRENTNAFKTPCQQSEDVLRVLDRWKEDRNDVLKMTATITEEMTAIYSILTEDPYRLKQTNKVFDLQQYPEIFHVPVASVFRVKQCLHNNSDYVKEKMHKTRELEDSIKALNAEKNSLATRLSAAAGANLRENNPNITDLSDPNRPTKLAEEFSELYDNQWTNAYDCIVNESKSDVVQRKAIDTLLTIIKESFLMCKDVAGSQLSLLNTTILRPTTSLVESPVSEQSGGKRRTSVRQDTEIKANDRRKSANLPPVQSTMIHDIRKGTADISINDLQQNKNNYMTQIHEKWFTKKPVQVYIQRCVELCWNMNLQSPPVHMDFSLQPGQTINKETYRHYTTSGRKVEFVCWPALYLSEKGSGLLMKGVAQGTDVVVKNP